MFEIVVLPNIGHECENSNKEDPLQWNLDETRDGFSDGASYFFTFKITTESPAGWRGPPHHVTARRYTLFFGSHHQIKLKYETWISTPILAC